MAKQTRIERKHAELAARRDRLKAQDPTCDMDALIEVMKRAAVELDATPDNQEWTIEAMDRLESIRHEAIALKLVVEAIFETVNGR
jgi:hypothetical protein